MSNSAPASSAAGARRVHSQMAEDEPARRVHPRHFHAPSAAGGSPAEKLSQHELWSIFAFGHITELAIAMAVSRAWSAAVLSMPPLFLTFVLHRWEGGDKSVQSLCGSTLRRHVSRLWVPWSSDSLLWSRRKPKTWQRCAPEMMRLLAQRMSHLHELEVGALLCVDEKLPPPLLFPASLRRLIFDLAVCFGEHTDADTASIVESPEVMDFYNAAVVAIAQLQELEHLHLELQADIGEHEFARYISLAPLQSSRSLRSLVPPSLCMGNKVAKDVGLLTQLTSLRVGLALPLHTGARASSQTAAPHTLYFRRRYARGWVPPDFR